MDHQNKDIPDLLAALEAERAKREEAEARAERWKEADARSLAAAQEQAARAKDAEERLAELQGPCGACRKAEKALAEMTRWREGASERAKVWALRAEQARESMVATAKERDQAIEQRDAALAAGEAMREAWAKAKRELEGDYNGSEKELEGLIGEAICIMDAALSSPPSVAGVDKCESVKETTLDVEVIAAECHKQWAGWTEHVFGKCGANVVNGVPVTIIPNVWIERWTRQINTPYSDLSEKEKESDRVEARKIVAALRDRAASARKDGGK